MATWYPTRKVFFERIYHFQLTVNYSYLLDLDFGGAVSFGGLDILRWGGTYVLLCSSSAPVTSASSLSFLVSSLIFVLAPSLFVSSLTSFNKTADNYGLHGERKPDRENAYYRVIRFFVCASFGMFVV